MRVIKAFIKKNKIYKFVVTSIKYIFSDKKAKACFRFHKANGEELRICYELDETSIVFDCGGYLGDFADAIWGKYHSNIYVFEPVKEFYEKICQRFCDESKVKVFNLGIGATDESEWIYLNNIASSVYGNDNCERQQIVIKNISKFIEENHINNINLIKINIEGGEYELLEHLLDSGEINKYDNLQIQFHDVDEKSTRRMNDIQERLMNTHELMWSYRPFIWESWKRKRSQ